MRGSGQRSGELFSYVDLEKRVRADHPLRAIRELTDAALAALSTEFAALYATIGRPSVAPEKLLRAMLLQAFYSLRSERQLMERLEYDLLFRWFVGLGVDDPVWDHSTFSKNRDRLLEGEVAARFLEAVLAEPRVKRLLSGEHFSVDGTLIEAWASMKSVRPKAPQEPPHRPDGGESGGGRNAAVDFRGEKRSNATHASTTDPDARLYRKGPGMQAKLCFIGHGLMENRSLPDRRHPADPRLRPCRAAGGPGDDRGTRRPAAGGDARHRPGLRCRRFRRGTAWDERTAARRAQRERPPLGDRRTHHPSSGICREPADPQADRGGVRLDQDGRRAAPDQAAWPRQGGLGVRLRRRRLQPGAGAQADRRRDVSGAGRATGKGAPYRTRRRNPTVDNPVEAPRQRPRHGLLLQQPAKGILR